MIDIQLIRESPEIVKENIKKKFQDGKLILVDRVRKKDLDWRNLKTRADKLRQERNQISQEIAKVKKQGKSASALMKAAKLIPDKIAEIERKMNKLQNEVESFLAQIPNIMHNSVPIGKNSTENLERQKIGNIQKFNFQPKNHIELGESLKVLDFDSSAKTSGNGFYYIKGDLALLNQAIINFAIDKMTSKGYTYVETPLMLRGDIIKSVVDLNDMKNQIYKMEGEDLYLIGTSEHSLIGRFKEKMFNEKELPVKNTSYSMSFRKEIGSHGIEEKGLFRTHQFNKVEMIVICNPSESEKFFEEMKNITIELFKELEIPIRALEICSGDLGDLKHKQIDVEAWSPVKKEYYEVGSCSNLTGAQARKLKMRAITGKGERIIPHTLNNTAVATSRALIAIMENHQNHDGTINIPKILQKYMNGKTKIEKIK